MRTIRNIVRLAAVLALVPAAMTAQAALTVYTTSASFAAATTSSVTDSFDDLPIDPVASPLLRSVGSFGYTVTTVDPDSRGLFGVGDGADAWLSTESSGVPLVFGSFTGGVRAVGGLFFGSDADFAFLPGQTMTVTVVDSLGATQTQTIANATATSFVGFSSTGNITSLTVSIGDTETFATANDLVLASVPTNPVPEPATIGMLLAGLGALAFVRRRQVR